MHRPKSFIIGVSAVIAVVLAWLLAVVISTFQLARGLSLMIAALEFVSLIGSMAGIIIGLRFSTQNKTQRKLNWIGIVMNVIVFVGLMSVLYFAFTHSPRR